MKNMSVRDIMNSIVPITRFNKGEASKIFDEVSESGAKIVLKNNVPACVLVEPEQYEMMLEALEDYALYVEAEQRLKQAEEAGFVDQQEVYASLQIEAAELDDVEVEIE